VSVDEGDEVSVVYEIWEREEPEPEKEIEGIPSRAASHAAPLWRESRIDAWV